MPLAIEKILSISAVLFMEDFGASKFAVIRDGIAFGVDGRWRRKSFAGFVRFSHP